MLAPPNSKGNCIYPAVLAENRHLLREIDRLFAAANCRAERHAGTRRAWGGKAPLAICASVRAALLRESGETCFTLCAGAANRRTNSRLIFARSSHLGEEPDQKKDVAMGIELWMAVAAAAAAGAGVTGWLVRRSMLRAFDSREQEIVDSVNEKNATIKAKLRAALESAKHESEQLRGSIAAQIAQAVSDSKSAVTRLEGRLEIAYAELDNLRAQANPKPAARRDLANAFAATEVMDSRL
jgi:hypothetical protein